METKGKVSCFIVNINNSINRQTKMVRHFCKDKLIIEKIYVIDPGDTPKKYYELIKDIKNKSMDILLINIFTFLGLSEKETGTIINLCREYEITVIEV